MAASTTQGNPHGRKHHRPPAKERKFCYDALYDSAHNVMNKMEKVSVLFVCLGNICRSPTAQGVFRSLLAREQLAHLVEVDSAGTHAFHAKEPPDRRAQTSALKRGVDISDLRARRVSVEDFHRFDYIIAMDRDNLGHLERISPAEHSEKLQLFLDFAPDLGLSEVPDPYYGGPSGFERVLDMIEVASLGLLDDIRRRHFD